MKLKKGLVHMYTGEGKGKTTAALGLGIRAAGCGLRVCFFQFFKSGKFPCGEAKTIKCLGKKFRFKRFDIAHPMFKKIGASDMRIKLDRALAEANTIIQSKKFDLVILDEVIIGVSQGFIKELSILKIIKSKPEEVELVLTGRGATKKLLNSSDYVTCMQDIKHPFKSGICSRAGIEF